MEGGGAGYHHVTLGLNYRMTDIAAAIGLHQLSNMNEFLKKRRKYGKTLREGIEKIGGLHPQKVDKEANHSYNYFSVIIDTEKFKCNRDEFIATLKAENIDSAVHYPIPLTKQPAITNLMKPERCPISEDISARIFSLPMHPGLSEDDLKNILPRNQTRLLPRPDRPQLRRTTPELQLKHPSQKHNDRNMNQIESFLALLWVTKLDNYLALFTSIWKKNLPNYFRIPW